MNFYERLQKLSDGALNISIEETEANIDSMHKAIDNMKHQIVLFEHALVSMHDEQEKRVSNKRKLFKVVK